MKTYNVIKIGFLAAAMLLPAAITKAQPSLPNTQNPITYTPFTPSGTESIDSVTVGSRMPYKVDAQPTVAITDYSFEYKWLFSPALTVQSLAGAGLTGNSGYYDSNEISVVVPATAGDITVSTNVRSMYNGVELCTAEATDVTNTIRVLPRPTVQWTSNQPVVGCVAADVNIPVTLTGQKQFEIEYIIDYYDKWDKSGGLTSSSSSAYMVVPANGILTFPASTFVANGLYEIRITGITDRISRKSLDMSLVASVPADLPASPFQVNVVPAPVTNPLQHVKNIQ
jgi:hypothetical protein